MMMRPCPSLRPEFFRRCGLSFRTGIFIIFLLVFISSGLAQDERDQSGAWNKIYLRGRFGVFWKSTFRLRYEKQHGYDINSFGLNKNEDFLLSRVQVNFRFELPWNLTLVTQLQDARVFGSSFTDSDFAGKNNPFHDNLDLNAGYLSLKPWSRLEIRAGRQIISLGERRVFGPGQWGNTGRYSWDALVLVYDSEIMKTTLLAGKYIIHDPERWPNRAAAGPAAYAMYSSIKDLPLALDIFYVFKNDTRGQTVGEAGAGNLSSHSAGLRIDGRYRNWSFNAIYARQFGRWGADRIAAYGLVMTAGYSLNLFRKTELQAMYVLGSGDSHPHDGRHQTFDGIFSGADTVMYDWMTLVFWKNIRDYRLNLVISPGADLTLRAELHNFRLDEARDAWYDGGKAVRRDLTGNSGRNLGQEIDLVIQKRLFRRLEVLTGYCLFLPSSFVQATGPAPRASWFFFQTAFNL